MTGSEGEFKAIICVADDEDGIRFGLSRLFTRAGYQVIGCATGAEVLTCVRDRHPDLILLDVRLAGDMNGHEVLEKVLRIDPELLVLVITGYGTIESAVEAMKKGAEDYLVKPVDNAHLLNKVVSLLERRNSEGQDRAETRRVLADTDESLQSTITAPGENFVAESSAMQELLRLTSRVKDQDINVLITGESGVGKELIARHIHNQCSRCTGPFIEVNCAAFSETLLLSELFGHEKGAYTGAERRKLGCFERAHGGTLFLDEIGDMAPDTQAKLLRVLEDRRFERLGGNETVSVDARIIAATNHDVEELVRTGVFREDLYYRVNVLRLHIPPLRERPEDIRSLVRAFAHYFAAAYDRSVSEISDETMRRLLSYDWPGNVRELKNVMSQSVLLSATGPLRLFGLPETESHAKSRYAGPYHSRVSAAQEQAGRSLIISALRQSGGNKSEAARILGITRKTLQRRIAAFGVDIETL